MSDRRRGLLAAVCVVLGMVAATARMVADVAVADWLFAEEGNEGLTYGWASFYAAVGPPFVLFGAFAGWFFWWARWGRRQA